MVRILVVDDHPAIRRLIRQLLSQSQDLQVVAEASSGQEALECVRNHEPDVITLDMMMGDMNGLEVLNRLKAIAKRPKVIVISLYNTPQLVQRALESGADAYIPKKELSPNRLVEAVEEVTGKGEGLADQHENRTD